MQTASEFMNYCGVYVAKLHDITHIIYVLIPNINSALYFIPKYIVFETENQSRENVCEIILILR